MDKSKIHKRSNEVRIHHQKIRRLKERKREKVEKNRRRYYDILLINDKKKLDK